MTELAGKPACAALSVSYQSDVGTLAGVSIT